MSSIFLSLITLICIFFGLPAFYYLPVSPPPPFRPFVLEETMTLILSG